MISETGPDAGRTTASGHQRASKAAQNFFPALTKTHSSPSETNALSGQDGIVVQGAAAARSVYGSIPTISTPPAPPDALTQALHRLQKQAQGVLADQVTPLRLAGHLSVLLTASVILILSQVKIPAWELSLQATPQPAAGQVATVAWSQSDSGLFDNPALQRSPVLTFVDTETKQQAPRQEIGYYTVKPGDTVLAIAERYGLQPETLMWSNSNIEQNPDRLSVGDELRILPVNGVLHVVQPGETLSDLADEYDVNVDQIVPTAATAWAARTIR